MKCVCIYCKRKYTYIRGKGGTTKKCNSCITNRRRFELKKKCIEYKGGKCEVCGYNKSTSALTFHHLDPNKKDFGISGSHCRKWEDIKLELDKCQLLCANCHQELHSKREIKFNP